MSNELVPVTILVPPPPSTHEIVPGRESEYGEKDVLYFDPFQWEWHLAFTKPKPDAKKGSVVLAFPKPRPKRLLRPEELAGKWLRKLNAVRLVIAVTEKETIVAGIDRWEPVSYWHDGGWEYSTTPDGPRLPLEVEDKP